MMDGREARTSEDSPFCFPQPPRLISPFHFCLLTAVLSFAPSPTNFPISCDRTTYGSCSIQFLSVQKLEIVEPARRQCMKTRSWQNFHPPINWNDVADIELKIVYN